MRHARDQDPSSPAPPAPSRSSSGGGRHRKGRHTATRSRRSPILATVTPKSWPLSVGVGLAVAVATTTSFSVASPGATDPHQGDGSGSTAPTPAALPSGAGTSFERAGAASRSGERSAPGAVQQGGTAVQGTGAAGKSAKTSQVVVSADAKMSTAASAAADIAAAPQPKVKAAPPPVLPGCDGRALGTGSNGYVPASELCNLWDGQPAIRADAAVALAKLNEAFTATFGEEMCITDGYRSYAQQVATKAAKGYLAATPGTSNHGWGLAVDICPETYSGARFDWLVANAPAYGWDNPDWAKTSKYEPWHWEYTAAVAQMDTGY